MPQISLWELLLVLLVAVCVLGPKEYQTLAREGGRCWRRLREYWSFRP